MTPTSAHPPAVLPIAVRRRLFRTPWSDSSSDEGESGLPGTSNYSRFFRDVPDIEFAGNPACRISDRSKSRIPGILQGSDTGYPAGYPAFGKKRIVQSATSH